MFEGGEEAVEDAGAFEAAIGAEAGAIAGALGAADGDEERAVAPAIEDADADEAHAVAAATEAAEGGEAGAETCTIDEEEEEEGLVAADRRGLLFAADRRVLLFAAVVVVILAVVLAVETLAYAVGAFEAAYGHEEAGAVFGALGAADDDEPRAIEAADDDEVRALADAIEAAEANEAGAAAGAIEEEEEQDERLDGDHRALLFAAVGVILAVVVAVATVTYAPPPPAAGRVPAYPGDATNVLSTIDGGIGRFPKGGTSIWPGWWSDAMQGSPRLQMNQYHYLRPADARLPRLSRRSARRFVRPTSLLLTAVVYTAYYHARLHFVDYTMLTLVASLTALVLYVDGAAVQLEHHDAADEGLLRWVEMLVPNVMRFLRRG